MSYISSPSTSDQQHLLGRKREQQFFDAFYKHTVVLPTHVHKIVRATAQEDADGIDGWAYSDYGRIPLQLTSSRLCMHLHRQRRPTSDAVLIVVYEHETPFEIQAKTRLHLEQRIAHLKKKERVARW
jgi:hypothetical protein